MFALTSETFQERVQEAATSLHLPEPSCPLSQYMLQMITMRRAMYERDEVADGRLAYYGPDDFYYRTGKSYAGSRALSQEQQDHLLACTVAAGKQFRQRECFCNGMRLALADHSERIRYVEGYALLNVGLPIHHGWAVLDGEHVIDLTVRVRGVPTASPRAKGIRRYQDRIIGTIPEGYAYWGTTFRNAAVCAFMVANKVYGPVVTEDYARGHPYLTGKLVP